MGLCRVGVGRKSLWMILAHLAFGSALKLDTHRDSLAAFFGDANEKTDPVLP